MCILMRHCVGGGVNNMWFSLFRFEGRKKNRTSMTSLSSQVSKTIQPKNLASQTERYGDEEGGSDGFYTDRRSTSHSQE